MNAENCIINTQFQSLNNDTSNGCNSEFTYVSTESLDTDYVDHLKVEDIMEFFPQSSSESDESSDISSIEESSDEQESSPISDSSSEDDQQSSSLSNQPREDEEQASSTIFNPSSEDEEQISSSLLNITDEDDTNNETPANRNTAAIVGGTVGGVAGVSVIVVIVVLVIKKGGFSLCKSKVEGMMSEDE